MLKDLIPLAGADRAVVVARELTKMHEEIRSGTLGEFAIAYDEGRLIGVLTGTGGMADRIADMLPFLEKPTGAHVLFDDNPVVLIDRLIDYYRAAHYKKPNCYCSADDLE